MRSLLVTSLLLVVCIGVAWPLAVVGADPLSAEPSLWLPTIYGPPAPTATPALPQVRVAAKCSQFDAPGDDNQNLNEEYVCFENYGDTAVDMTGWQVADEAGKRYTFPAFVLAPKAIVRLRTGSGINTQTDLYWESARAIWNNAGDTVYLYDGSGNLVNRYRYDRALLARPS